MAESKRTFVKPFVAVLDGEVTHFLPGDQIDADVATALKCGDHLFEDGDNGLVEKIKATVAEQHNRTPVAPATGLGAMSPAELKAYAAENGIAVGEASRKADLLAVISQAETKRAAEAQRVQDEAAAQEAADKAAAAAQVPPQQ